MLDDPLHHSEESLEFLNVVGCGASGDRVDAVRVGFEQTSSGDDTAQEVDRRAQQVQLGGANRDARAFQCVENFFDISQVFLHCGTEDQYIIHVDDAFAF